MNRRTWTNTITQDPDHLQGWMQPESQLGWSSDSLDLAMLADGFDPITLKEMDEVALLNRIDTKFVHDHQPIVECAGCPSTGLLDAYRSTASG